MLLVVLLNNILITYCSVPDVRAATIISGDIKGRGVFSSYFSDEGTFLHLPGVKI